MLILYTGQIVKWRLRRLLLCTIHWHRRWTFGNAVLITSIGQSRTLFHLYRFHWRQTFKWSSMVWLLTFAISVVTVPVAFGERNLCVSFSSAVKVAAGCVCGTFPIVRSALVPAWDKTSYALPKGMKFSSCLSHWVL